MTLIDLCCVLDTMLIKMLFIQRTKTTHTLQQLPTRFSMQCDDPNYPVMGSTVLRAKATSMGKAHIVSLFWRLHSPTGPKDPFIRANFIVDVPRKKTVVVPKDDEYVWLVPEHSNLDAEPFPQDGRHGCDTYEYSYVDISGEPEPDPEPVVAVVKKTARTRPSMHSLGRESDDGTASTTTSALTLASAPVVRADTRLIAEDPVQWAGVLHTGDRALNVVNLGRLEDYYKATFGNLGADASQKEMVAHITQTLYEDMRAVMADASFIRGEYWVKARCRDIHKLSMLRNLKVGYPKELVREMNQAYEETTIPEWQRAIHTEACQRVKITNWKGDPRVTPSHGSDLHGDLSAHEPKGPNGGAKGKAGQYGGHDSRESQSTAAKKAAADKKAAGTAFLASLKGKLTPAELSKIKDFC